MSIASLLASIFLVLALVHLYWATGGLRGIEAALPQVRVINTVPQGACEADGERTTMANAFTPRPQITLMVAFGLGLIALLVAVRAGLVGPPVKHWAIEWSLGALGVVMLARAVGEFRLVGFFKTVKGSRFARLDSWCYSPLCVVLAAGLGWVAASG
ncbi:MAG: hypothetical protein JWR60_3070 [Polaromonas sp.]|nr:hypothetical protein [Polaromonas sp.]